MAKLAAADLENSSNEATPEITPAKTPTSKRLVASPAAAKTNAAAAPSKKGLVNYPFAC